jgi:hypothetical protein
MSQRNTTHAGYGWQWQRLRLRILARDHGTCHYCAGPANTVDHVTPKIEGGTDHPANLVAACSSCNSRRSLAWVRANRGARAAGAVLERRTRKRESRAGGALVPTDPESAPVFWEHGAGLTTSAGFGPIPDEPSISARMGTASGVLAGG